MGRGWNQLGYRDIHGNCRYDLFSRLTARVGGLGLVSDERQRFLEAAARAPLPKP